jgi:hypothetical protein
MLTQIPVNTNKTMRSVVLRHPNSVEVAAFRKEIKRVDAATPGTMGGLPTLGGMGVLDSEDEDDFDYAPLGDGKLLPCEPFQPSSMVDRNDGIDAAEGVLMYCMVEPVAKPDSCDYFELKTRDLVFLIVWEGVYAGYEVVGRETNINIPPFTRRYVLQKRDDLKFLGEQKPVEPTA